MGKDIGTLIKDRRIELKLTLEDIGNAVGVSKSTVQRWESGQITNMRRDKIDALAKVLGLSPLMFVDHSAPSPEPDRPSYYADPETAEVAERLRTQPGMRMLFDASKDAKPEDLQYAADLLKRLKGDD